MLTFIQTTYSSNDSVRCFLVDAKSESEITIKDFGFAPSDSCAHYTLMALREYTGLPINVDYMSISGFKRSYSRAIKSNNIIAIL